MTTWKAVAALAAALASGTVAAQGLVEWREQAIPGVCTFRFAVPEGWTTDARTPAPGAVVIRLAPAAGPPAEVLLRGSVPAPDAPLRSTGDLKRAARSMGEEMLAGAVERKIDLERVDGTDGAGFFYTLTDRRAELPEGEFRVTTQGVMAVGELRLALTVLAPEKGSPAAKMALALLRTAECRRAGR